jgi:hypothetical protein
VSSLGEPVINETGIRLEEDKTYEGAGLAESMAARVKSPRSHGFRLVRQTRL